MKLHYSSPDKKVEKNVIKHGKISNKPQEGSICYLDIGEIKITPQDIDLKYLNSKLLIANSQVIFTVDEALSEVDKLIERAVKWMGENEEATISICLPSATEKEEESQPNRVEFKAILTKHEPFKPIWRWTPEEKLDRAQKYKEMAVELMKISRVKDAFHRFSKAIKIIISMEPIGDLGLDEKMTKEINDLRISLYNNMAICQLKYNNYDHTIELCTKVLIRDEDNVKALYRRGCAYGGNKDVEKACKDFVKASEIEPNNIAVKEKLKSYEEKWKQAQKQSNDMVKRMFK